VIDNEPSVEAADLMRPCPICANALPEGLFDMSWKTDGRGEQLTFNVPARMCFPCGQMYVDAAILDMLQLSAAVCTFAIASDKLLTA
jgi:hypothetical protein